MGMFDDIYVPTGLKSLDGVTLTCFQTKSLDSLMNFYYIVEGKLFCSKRTQAPKTYEPFIEDGAGSEILVHHAPEVAVWEENYTGNINFYTSDHKNPLYVLGTDFSGTQPRIVTHAPWVEFRATVVKGKIIDIQYAEKSQTRESLKIDLLHKGMNVLADDDPRIKLQDASCF